MVDTLALSAIRIDGGTQPRSKIDENVVAEYAAAMRDGADFPPLVVFRDGVDNWLADGFHRFHAARQSNFVSVAVEFHTGTKRDAILYSVGANAKHGQRRTNDDKRKAVLTLLNDSEWSAWSNKAIARHCAVNASTVDDWRSKQLPDSGSCSPRKYVHHESGKPTTMRTENIGRRAPVERIESEPHEPATHAPIAKSRGVGLGYAHKAISFLQQIPLDDGLRDEAFDTVAAWINDNR